MVLAPKEMQVHPPSGAILMHLEWFGASGVCDWYREHK